MNNFLKKEDKFFSKWCWENWRDAYKSMNLDDTLTPHEKYKLKMAEGHKRET